MVKATIYMIATVISNTMECKIVWTHKNAFEVLPVLSAIISDN
jgi:hypothetical protein